MRTLISRFDLCSSQLTKHPDCYEMFHQCSNLGRNLSVATPAFDINSFMYFFAALDMFILELNSHRFPAIGLRLSPILTCKV